MRRRDHKLERVSEPESKTLPSLSVRRRRFAVIAGLIVVALVAGVVAVVVGLQPRSEPVATSEPAPAPTATATPTETPMPTPTPPPVPAFDKTAMSIDDPASPWVVVNKLRPLNPGDYAPADLVDVPVPFVNAPKLRKEASDAVVAMFAAFQSQTGLQMQSQSAYRSYSSQVSVYAGWVSSLGQAGADLTSARPGHSEHQTGLAIDVSALPAVCALQACFGETPQGQWLAANAWTFGFTLRYPQGATPITGYEYEPWHYRYVGTALAAELHTSGVATLEEFFGLPPAPTY
jgi:D-alanyl-D-alanine carboxypeptidase